MRIERILIFISLMVSLAALSMSVVALKKDNLGTDLSNYNLSSPEDTLKSINKMVANYDLKAGFQLFKLASQNNTDPSIKLFFSDQAEVKVLKSIEVSNSAAPENNGLIVSFVKFNVSGVDYYVVKYFRKDQSNRFYFGDSFYMPYGTEKNAQDQALEAAIEEFKKTGKLIIVN